MKASRRIILLLTLLLTAAVTLSAAQTERRERWRDQLQEYKHKYLTRALGLSTDQAARFFPLYDEMEDRIEDLNNETRDIQRRIDGDNKLSDVALEAYSRRLFEQKRLEADIELEYYDKYKTILTPRQLARIKPAELEIVRNLNRYRHGNRQD